MMFVLQIYKYNFIIQVFLLENDTEMINFYRESKKVWYQMIKPHRIFLVALTFHNRREFAKGL